MTDRAYCLNDDFLTGVYVVAGVHVKLTEEEIKSIDDLYQPRSVFGHQ